MDRKGFHQGIALFNEGHFFDAHEVLEDVWRAAPEPERKFLQGLIQIAVAFHHRSTGNLAGAASVLRRGARNLAPYSGDFGGIRLDAFRAVVRQWEAALQGAGPSPPLPRIELLGC